MEKDDKVRLAIAATCIALIILAFCSFYLESAQKILSIVLGITFLSFGCYLLIKGSIEIIVAVKSKSFQILAQRAIYPLLWACVIEIVYVSIQLWYNIPLKVSSQISMTLGIFIPLYIMKPFK